MARSVGLDNSVGIATFYRLNGPGIASRWGRILQIRSDQPWAPPSLLYNGHGVIPLGKAAGGVEFTTHSYPVLGLKKEYSNSTSTPPLLLHGLF